MSESRIPPEVIEIARKMVQPHPRKKRRVSVVLIPGVTFPELRTVNGRTTAVISKEALCGDYYD